MMKLGVLMIAGAGLLSMTPSYADTMLMSYDEYMVRCLNTYGEDKLTKSVCDSQYQAIEKKEQELMAQTTGSQKKIWSTELPENEQAERAEY